MAADDYHVITKHGKTTATSAVSPNSIKKPKERVPAKPGMPEVNQLLMCQLCSGYLIDATAIIECQHTFCKSCILKYLDTNTYCPICDVQLNKAKPQYSSLRSDVSLQRLVYKLVPGLLMSEIRRRRDFHIEHGMDPFAAAEQASNSLATEIEASTDMSTVLSLDDVVSLSIEYFRSSDDNTSTTSTSKVADTNGKQQQSTPSVTQSSQKSNVRASVNSSGGTATSKANSASCPDSKSNDDTTSEQANDRRYLQCPAGVSVGLLKKFIRRKYGLSDEYRVDLLYNGNRDCILESDLTLLDVAFIYKWNKDDPMKFQYRIFERPAKSITVFAGMKRPAPSVMDEPPDDDTASGPHSRSSMYSSAPSSKLPRLGGNAASQGNQGSVAKGSASGKSRSTSDNASTSAPENVPSKAASSTPTPTVTRRVERDDDEDDDDDDDEEDYELVERKEHMKGIKSSRKQSIKESMKRSVAASNLRSQISRSSSSHSTEGKEEHSESGNENSLNSSKKPIAPVKKKDGRGRPPKSVDSLRLRVTSTENNSTGSLKMSISTSGITPVVSSNSGVEKKEPLKLSLGSVLANKGGKSPDRKHHKHKHHHHHKLKHKEKHGKESSSSSSSSSSSNQKPIKLSFTLSPPGTATVQQGGSQSKSSGVTPQVTIKDSGNEGKEQKPKVQGTPQNFNNSARTSASAHGHLNNISKSISVSVNTNSGAGASNSTQNSVKGNQFGKVMSPAELIPKNTGIEIQPTTIPISTANQISQQPSGQANNSANSHKHSHPLLPDSVHVPKSVTLIPVNPNQMGNNSGAGSGSSLEKGGSHQATQNRMNAHTFTHPITNKSLHQITVTEVPPPQKQSGGQGSGNNTNLGSSIANNTIPTLHQSISGTTSNPIEKVIASAANNKPQFNGPGSMEITKIYCGTPNNKESAAKKLKDRRGLDISITGTGINVNVNKSTQKLEETLRQKVNISGGGTGSISVTPVAAPNTMAGGNSNNIITTTTSMNKMNKVATTAANLLSGKMPPGITIGPATIPQNQGNNNQGNNSGNVNSNNSAAVGNNIMKGLGFTLPPHLTAHPHNPNKTSLGVQGKVDKNQSQMPQNQINTNNSRLMGKDVSIIGKQQQQQPPPPVEITISASGNKNQQNRGGVSIVNKKMDPLASILDIAHGMRKSPVQNNTKDSKMQSQTVANQLAQAMHNKNMQNKKIHESQSAATGQMNKKKEPSPEMKKGRSASTSSETGSIKKEGEIPLDLSGGGSKRTTPPITIPQIREPSKSPSVNERRSASMSPEVDKHVISPSHPPVNNFLSPKMNNPKNPSQTQNKSISVSKLSPNQASKIGSIVDSLAQKQAQAQQQHLQSVKNSQQQQHHTHHHSSNVAALPTSTHSINSSGTGSSALKTSPNAGSSTTSSITSPISGSSLASPGTLPMTSSSPPGDHMRNLWSLTDTAARQGKLNELQLQIAASLFSPPGHPHPLANAAAAHQIAAAAAAANSPSGAGGAGGFNPALFAQYSHHLAALQGNKMPPGIFDPHLMAAINMHHAQAQAASAGMRMHHPFVGSMSPPLNIPNAFFPHGAPPPPQQQSPIGNSSNTAPKVPTVSPQNKSGGDRTGKNMPFAPLFSHSVPVSSPKSPNSSGPVVSAKSPTMPNHISPPGLPFSSASQANALSNASKDQKHTHSSHSSSSAKSGSNSHSSGTSVKPKINGTMSTSLPVFPPGIHNPLLQPRSNNSNSTAPFQSGNSTSSASHTLNKGFPSPQAVNKNVSKGGIPNSMKISNFLPSKPKESDANAEATITSSNFSISHLQSKPNFSSSPSRPPNDVKSPTFKEGPLSPVKASSVSPTNKPSSMTCASLLLPDTMYSKPSHHLLNSLSPPKGDHGLGSSRSNRTPSSDSVLLSPNSSRKSSSPGAQFSKSEMGGKPHRTLSPTKDDKKEKGIPMGASMRNFTPQTTQSLTHLPISPQCLSLTRPIPTIPAFFNRTAGSTPSMSSNTHHHHHHKDNKTSPGRLPTSPTKVSEPHVPPQQLPSPVFPFPGVSVPVQVKLQDDGETSNVTVAPAIPPISSPPSISLKSEVNKVIAAKEENVDASRKRPCPSSPKMSPKSPENEPKRVTISERNEVPPAKVQKMEEPVKVSVKTENTATPESKESPNAAASSIKTENESHSHRELEKEGEQERSEGVGADPSKDSSTPNSPCKVESLEKAGEVEADSKQTVSQVVVVEPALSEKQIVDDQEKLFTELISTEKGKPEEQIVVDKECPKSDEVNRQEASIEIPEGKGNEEISSNEQAENKEEMGDDIIDVEMVNEQEPASEQGQSENCMEVEIQKSVDISSNEIITISGESSQEKPKEIVEERLTLTKNEEDVDVDVVDIDEPMEVSSDGLVISIENEHIEEEPEKIEDEDICNDNEEPITLGDNHEGISSPMEAEDNDSNMELVELPVNPSAPQDEDAGSLKVVSEDEPKYPIEMSGDVTETKLDESSLVEDEPSSHVQDKMEESCGEIAVEMEGGEESTTFLGEESTNFSQDDSECGDLIIDLGPTEEEIEDNKVEEIDELAQTSPVILEEKSISEDIFSEVGVEQALLASPESEKLCEEVNEPSSTLLINSEQDIEQDEGSELNENISSTGDDEHSATEVVSTNVERESQDSILNQITINPVSIEVNGVIKADMGSEESETVPPLVSDCPQQDADSANENGEGEKEGDFVSRNEQVEEEALSGNVEDAERNEEQETVLVLELDTPQLAQLGSPIPPVELSFLHDAVDNEGIETEEKIEEEEVTIFNSAEIEMTFENFVEDSNAADAEELVIDETLTSVENPDNNVAEPDNISVSDDIPEQTSSEEATLFGTPMETEEEQAGQVEEVAADVDIDMTFQEDLLSTTTVPEIDDESMQIEADSVLPTDDSSTCVPTDNNVTVLETTIQDEPQSLEASAVEEIEDIALISATITAEEILEENIPSPLVVEVTPTSSSSIAIKLNIANNEEVVDNALTCGDNAESLPSTASNSLIPSSNNIASSSSSSPVDVSPTTAGLKSLETFGKVAAGLLASATGTINNNNNNSLAPTSCDAISIATTNANA